MSRFFSRVGAAVAAVVVMAGAARAIDLSAGVSGTYIYNFRGIGTIVMEGTKMRDKGTVESGGGFNAFFDATYAEVGIGMVFLGGYADDEEGEKIEDTEYSTTGLNFSVMLKLPLKIGSGALFPIAGFDYELCVAGSSEVGSETYKWKKNVSDNSRFWLKGGLGADISVTDAIYIRPVALFGWAGPTTANEKNAKMLAEADREKDRWDEYTDNNVGLTFKLGVGYRF